MINLVFFDFVVCSDKYFLSFLQVLVQYRLLFNEFYQGFASNMPCFGNNSILLVFPDQFQS